MFVLKNWMQDYYLKPWKALWAASKQKQENIFSVLK